MGEPPPPAYPAATTQDFVTGSQACSACGAPNLAEARFCDQCGSPLGPGTQPRQAAPAARPAPPPAALAETMPEAPARSRFVSGRLALEPTGTRLEFPPGRKEIFVGREDPISDIFPEVDLTPFGGEAAGVSRRHARFTLVEGELVVEDLDSTNFTFVNRKRVMPGARQAVKNGDELRFGRMTARYEEI
jgi:pSer/pThr/pTyr-binding forkhead associated (FHA) protein